MNKQFLVGQSTERIVDLFEPGTRKSGGSHHCWRRQHQRQCSGSVTPALWCPQFYEAPGLGSRDLPRSSSLIHPYFSSPDASASFTYSDDFQPFPHQSFLRPSVLTAPNFLPGFTLPSEIYSKVIFALACFPSHLCRRLQCASFSDQSQHQPQSWRRQLDPRLQVRSFSYAAVFGATVLTRSFPGHPNLNLTAEEKRVYGQLLKEADPDGFGAVSGDVAVKFFERTKLPPDVLGQVKMISNVTM